MNESKLRVGVVGCGYIATDIHLPVLSNLRDVRIVSICDKNDNLAKEVANQFGVKNHYTDFSKMLEEEKIDIVDVLTPPQTHASLSIMAMNAGCHVLVEKPMATSVVDADRMIIASKKQNVRLCVVHQNLYNPAVIKARQLVEKGVVGDLLNVDMQTFEIEDSRMILDENHWCHTLPGGIFCELLPHPIYGLQLFLRNMEPVHVLGRKLGNVKWMANDELRVEVEAENGLGSIKMSCNSPIQADTIDILGTRMALRVDLWGRTIITQKPRTESPLSIGMGNLHLSLQLFKVATSTASIMFKMLRDRIRVKAHYAFISEFIKSMRSNTKTPTTGEDGKETVKILEMICKQLK